MKLFAASLSLFCLYLFHCEEARAMPLASRAACQAVDRSPLLSVPGGGQSAAKAPLSPIPFVFSAPGGLFASPVSFLWGLPRLPFREAKEFRIRSGLSPPFLPG
jgi:hypothetical protein